MLVVTFDPDQFNFITVGENSYFLLRFPDGSLVLYNDCCDHRGGPLHLGHWDHAGKCLVCPWHGTKYSEKVLRDRARPLIRRPGRVTAVLDTEPSTPVQLVKKTILAQPDRSQADFQMASACTKIPDPTSDVVNRDLPQIKPG